MSEQHNPQMTTPEQKIIQATIQCIEEFGLENATNRRIAALAEVNIAAINYYFRSKKNLIDQVMDITLDNAFDWADLNQLPGETAQQWCIEVFIDLTKGAARYPGLTRAHFHDVIINGNYESLGARRMMAFMQQLAQELKERGIKKPIAEIELSVAQIGSAFISTANIPHFFESSFQLNLTDEVHIRTFFTSLVTKVLGE